MVTKEKAKQNGVAKRTVATQKNAVKAHIEKKTEEKATTKEVVTPTPQPTPPVAKVKTLDERLSSFERMKGLANQRERLNTTLTDLNKFKYQNSDSCVFLLRDENGKEFKTTNNNLIQLVTDVLQEKLTTRKTEIEKSILEFDM